MNLGNESIRVHTGSGIDRRPGVGDVMKVVTGNGTCSDSPAAGTSVVSDLGPDDSYGDPTEATVHVNFTAGGSYKALYRLH